MQFYTDSSSVNPTQVSFSALDTVLYGLIVSKPYTGFLPPKMQFYTNSPSRNPTQVLSFQRWSFTRTRHQETLHRFPSTPNAASREPNLKVTLHRFPLSTYKKYISKISPVDSGSFFPAEHERVSRLYSKVISLPGYNWVILSQKPRKDRPRWSLLIPSRVC